MRILISLWLAAILSSTAFAADNPDWAYPATPKPEPLDNTTPLTAAGSAKQYTAAQVDDAFNPPDWFPQDVYKRQVSR